MNVGEAIRFVFEDEEWLTKLLVGAAISIIPLFGGAALTGYAIAVLRNVEADSRRPLPTWDALGEFFVDGLLFWVATLIYSVPLLIFLCPIAVVWVLPAIGGDNQSATAVLTSIAGIISAGLGCLSLLYGILLWLISPVLQIRYAEAGQLAACLQFGDVFRFLFRNIGPIVIAQLVLWAAGVVVTTALSGIIGILSLVPICGWVIGAVLGLGMLPVGAWLMLVGAHLYAQVARQSEPAPVV